MSSRASNSCTFVGVLGVPVREVGGEEELVLADDGGGVGEHLLVGPRCGKYQLPCCTYSVGDLRSMGASSAPRIFHFSSNALQPVGHPSASGLHPADAQAGEAFRYAGEHHADHVAEEADGGSRRC